ncbi:MAG: neutral/alkaline non-lysosomal ceramidase N-terminal domain-containing protein [Planctomycetota bacterium]|nr:neutral/alkaline non-lysosomal ceramidase N-terminal domain-containing protein [Planctomycetota bacterium]MDA1250874.1 neutral/alkaline non-lysosomal ceramidase N-terminal domain-containing protein [Planctomycetota bacterium]
MKLQLPAFRFERFQRVALIFVAALAAVVSADRIGEAADSWQAGVARVVITPDEPMWLSGYGGRSHASEGKVTDLFARAAAIRDAEGETAVFVSLDLIGVPIKMVREVSGIVEERLKIPRRGLMFACSHTHSGPALDHSLSYMLNMQDADWAQVKAYQKVLNAKVVSVIEAAVADLKPARLSTGSGVSRFASNRRDPKGLGPYDHQVPVLRIETPDGSQLRGVVFGYACHNTVTGDYAWSGDYAGFAQLYLEDRHPGCVAMFHTGCGADQNPLPRRKIELAMKYGRMLATSVDEVLGSEMKPVSGRLTTKFKEVDLEFATLPSKERLAEDAQSSSYFVRNRANFLTRQWDELGHLQKEYPYPVQVWKLGGGVTWVALGGEIVIDYQLRLKKELGEDSTWVTGYANDVMAYIPSERVLEEGGYEGDTSMLYYQKPSKWKTGLEEKIVQAVRELAGKPLK